MEKKTSTTTVQAGVSRRKFLGRTAAALAGIGIADGLFPAESLSSAEEKRPEARPAKIKEFRTLGRTGFKVSDVSFGSGELNEPGLLEAILDSGINYIDSSESYGRGQTERIIGRVLTNRNRKGIFVTTKLPLGRSRTKQNYLDRARKCLERLQTDYIDCLMMHGPTRVEDLKTEGFHAAIQELKTEGRVKFSGLSNHGSQWNEVPETMEQVLLAAAEDGRFDVMLLVYNFIQRDMGGKVLEACLQKNIGATLMKTNPVLNYMEVQEEIDKLTADGKPVREFQTRLAERLKKVADLGEPFKKELGLKSFDDVRRAAVKFALSRPGVNTACLTIKNFSDLEFYAGLSGEKPTVAELRRLVGYSQTYGELYCRHACGTCESSCPNRVPINTIMRYNHYFLAQGRQKTAMTKYARLPKKAELCLSCPGYCEASCPHQVPVQGLLAAAHNTLILG